MTKEASQGIAAELTDLASEYEILGELGRGGSAVVYHGRDRELGRDVAIKVVHPRPLSADDDPVARLAREARTVAQLQHPNIVTVFAVRRLAGGGLALVMQLVPGRTLKALVQKDGPVAPERCRRILHDVASALAFAHARGIVHRDVKPENIFLDDESGTALLSDFGIARSDEQDSMTQTGTAIGTPFYMSPEQIDGGTVDGRSDLYSLGVVAWEMLTGQRPWDGESLYNVIYKQKHEQLPPIEALRLGVPPRLQYIVERMLQKNPGARWAGAEGLLSHLSHSVLPGDYARWQATLSKRVERYREAERERAKAVAEPVSKSAGGLIASTIRFVRGATGADESNGLRAPTNGAGLADTTVVQTRAAVNGAAEQAARALAPARPAAARGAPRNGAGIVAPTWDIPRRRLSRRTSFALGTVVVAALGAATTLAVRDPSRWPTLRGVLSWISGLPIGGGDEIDLTDVAAAETAGTAEAPAPAVSLVAPAIGSEPARPVLALGGRHACAVMSSGVVQCWGANERGQLGDGTAVRQRRPVPIAAALTFSSVAAGSAQSCGVTVLGDVYCWGNDASGQLGDATTVRRNAPVRVAGPGVYRSVATGDAHTCAITIEGSIDCWGSNARGQLGDATNRARSTPGRVTGINATRFIQVVTGAAHTCALAVSGTTYCWGANERGQLGNGSGPDRRVAAPIGGNLRFVSITAGVAHTCGVLDDGGVRCWGANARGQLGIGTRVASASPATVPLPAAAATIAAGGQHTCALTLRGEALCWGANGAGQLGDSSRTDAVAPQTVISVVGLATLGAGASHSCAGTRSGEILCWGDNAEGQLGDGGTEPRGAPGLVGVSPGTVLASSSGTSRSATGSPLPRSPR